MSGHGQFRHQSEDRLYGHFLATFPANWNGKYLQLGCSGLCGNFFVSNPTVASITVTTQGYPTEIISKGYATFATDQGHETQDAKQWAVKSDGAVDDEKLQDYYYRADKVLARMGKEFTLAFYAGSQAAPRKIARSYFTGCSGGGRDAFVAASFFPEEFDGIIGGSPGNLLGIAYLGAAVDVASSRSPDANLTPALPLSSILL